MPSAAARVHALDVLIIGGGIGGVVALYYARKAGLRALVLERQSVIGGLWAQLPAWQDIQFGRIDWTLGDLPIAGEDQASIRDNIEAWVTHFGLSQDIRLNIEVTRAERDADGWVVQSTQGMFRAAHLIAATGGHNKTVIPAVQREAVELRELHSSTLRNAQDLTGRDILVVGGGASAYDLLDLCFEHRARRVIWAYRNVRWMMPTNKPKNQAGSPRALARAQMSGSSADEISRVLHADMKARYAKFGLHDIVPDAVFDLRRHQLIPGRWRMIENFAAIERHRGEVRRIDGRCVELSTGQRVEADLVLWATGYEVDLSFFANPVLSSIRRHEELAAQCGCGTRSIAEPGLYFMAAALESTGTATWSYALLARTIMSHIRGHARLELEPLTHKLNHFDAAAFLAERDPVSFPDGTWQANLRHLATNYPPDRALPIPD
jgi:lysine/ornithine N-monooxygenase